MELLSQLLAVEPASHDLGKDPLIPFAVLLLVILVVPYVFERLRIPGLVGLLASPAASFTTGSVLSANGGMTFLH